MSKLVRLVGAIVLVGVAAFCVYGFLSAPEAGADVGSVRLLYGAIGVVSVGGAAWLAWPRPAKPSGGRSV
jgi:hypothetical protein